ncbi:MAG: response regulator [Mariprofundaceae bacterium]
MILLVEDDVMLRTLFFEALTKARYAVQCYPEPKQALAALKNDGIEPDLIIFDQKLPDSTGYRFIEAAHTLCPEAPCLMISAYDLYWKKPDYAHFMPKPFGISRFIATVKSLRRSPAHATGQHHPARIGKAASS